MNIQWYPGHMTKTRRMIGENLKYVDVVAEVIDARIPIASRNPDIDDLVGSKPRVVILNRADQADPAASKQWAAYFRSKGISVLECDARSGAGVKQFSPVMRGALKEQIARWKEKGQVGRPVRAMVVGIPNVGKSTFINKVAKKKSAKAGDRPGVTRGKQWITVDQGLELLDTPGIHKPRNRLDSRMTQTAAASLKDVDVTLMLFEPTGEFTESELGMVEALRKAGPAIAVINKVDLLNDFAALEARKKQVEEFGIFDAIVTVSAKDGTGCEELFPLLKQYANPGPHYFDDDAFTDMPEKELVAELVREKALLFMREEIPHGIAVMVESFKERPDSDLIDISVEICCERKSHKGMIIGKGGQMLKKIASAARMDCEELLGARVNLQCWVKVREDWRDNDRLLDNLGFAKP